MKCPKCGFNSFEYYDNCKKCSGDLTGYKQTYSITSLVIPHEAKELLTIASRPAESATGQISDTAETHDDIFSFDLSDDSSSASATGSGNPFDFSEPSRTVKQSHSKPEDDVFSDLLESTPQAKESPFGELRAAVSPAAAKSANVSAGPAEFDLGNFSWDDTPADTNKKSAAGDAEGSDDFDSLFGDTKEDSSK